MPSFFEKKSRSSSSSNTSLQDRDGALTSGFKGWSFTGQVDASELANGVCAFLLMPAHFFKTKGINKKKSLDTIQYLLLLSFSPTHTCKHKKQTNLQLRI
jgi:hypothetical protein